MPFFCIFPVDQSLQNMAYADHIKWGMIGTGSVTEKKSAPSFNKIAHSELAAVMNRNPEKAREYASRHGVPRVYEQAGDLIRDPGVNAIYIATPPSSHMEYALAAIEAGKAVYIEKPMALNGEECAAINRAAATAGVPVFVAYYRRELEYFHKVKEILESGRLGRVLNIQLEQFYAARPEDYDTARPPWRVIPSIAGGGYFHDLGCHALDILFHLFGNPLEVSGRASNSAGLYEAPDLVSASLMLPRDIHLNGAWSFVHPEPFQKDRVSVFGEKGRMQFSIFTFEAIEVVIGRKEEIRATVQPEHIQLPLITSIVQELRGVGSCPSTGETAEVCSHAMDLICNTSL